MNYYSLFAKMFLIFTRCRPPKHIFSAHFLGHVTKDNAQCDMGTFPALSKLDRAAINAARQRDWVCKAGAISKTILIFSLFNIRKIAENSVETFYLWHNDLITLQFRTIRNSFQIAKIAKTKKNQSNVSIVTIRIYQTNENNTFTQNEMKWNVQLK